MSNVNLKTKIHSGQYATDYLKSISHKKILIVCDEFMAEAERIQYLTNLLNKTNVIDIFDKAIPDPTSDVCVLGVKKLFEVNPDIIIGYGGGSPIDTAKAILYFANQKNKSIKPLFVAVPTTSGTGTEVTSVSVIKDSETEVKHLIVTDDILPDIALLDPSLTLTVPKQVTANTGIDVLTHALEAYVATGANVFSDAVAEKSVELLFSSLLVCYNEGANLEARQTMQEASTLAGIAFNSAGLGLNHSIAHQLGATFHIPHGLANALLVNRIIDFNSQDIKSKEKYAKIAYKTQIASITDSVDVAVNKLKDIICLLSQSMLIPKCLSELGIDKIAFEQEILKMVENAKLDFCFASNPICANEIDIKDILNSVY